ncbi:MAG: chorismate-binding protein [Azonexus sp.]|jgi:isochorismate synthase|nr:chorismate-binding protein [Azonexus sp.]
MIARLRQHLASPALASRLARLAAGAPAAAPVSLCLPLGAGERDWLELLAADVPFHYQAAAARGDFRLGIGQVFCLDSSGQHRFAALDNALAGLCRVWRHEGEAVAFAGFAFAPDDDGAFPNARLTLPAITLLSRGGQCAAILSIPAGRINEAAAEWRRWLDCLPQRPDFALPPLLPPPPDMLARRAFLARCERALAAIASGRVDKLVLSRERRLLAAAAIPPAAVLARLLAQQPESRVFACGNGRQTFLGATPERLVRLAAGQIDADALAGTAWPGSPELTGSKNRHEQSLVVRAICQALAPLAAAAPQAAAATAHASGQLTHLRSRVTAPALPDTRLFDLVRALHPTPAVGGYPGPAALAWLTAHGERRSAWYSGGVGCIEQNGDGEFSVALRSALLVGSTAVLQAGAGIVAASRADDELAETEAKFGTMLAALSADPASAIAAAS